MVWRIAGARRWILGAAAAAAMIVACQALPRERNEHELRAEETLLPEVPAERILPLIEQRRTFEVVEGDARGERVAMELRRAAAGEPGEWVMVMDDLNTLYLRRDEAGNVMVVRMDLPREGYALVYEPALRLIPSRLRPQLRVEETAKVRVYDLKSGALQHRGDVQHTVEEVTRSRFRTPQGDQDGYMVVIEHSIDLSGADLSMEMQAGYLPGEGMVYRHMRYTIVRLGLFGSTTRRTAVVVE